MIGSGTMRPPPRSATPPAARMARIERIRCWFIPMRPVTPCMTMPSRRVPSPAFAATFGAALASFTGASPPQTAPLRREVTTWLR